MDKISSPVRESLNRAMIAFQLKDGNIVWIGEDDVEAIVQTIVCRAVGSSGSRIQVCFTTDNNITKAKDLHSILSTAKDIPIDLRIEYYKEILRLYGSNIPDNIDTPLKDIVGKKTS